MGANNWTTCPKCMKMAVQKKAEVQKQMKEGYGKILIEKYEELRTEAAKVISFEETFREDYEFDMNNDGTFTAGYRGHCDRCCFLHEYKHEEEVDISQ